MHVRLALRLALASLLTIPPGAQAQARDTVRVVRGGLSLMATRQLAPVDLGTFMAAAQQMARAASEANLEEAFGWTMWRHHYTVIIHTDFHRSALDDPLIWMKQFMRTPGEATFMQASQHMETVRVVRAWNEIVQTVPEWIYWPEGMEVPPYGWTHIHEFWLKSGEENFQEWNALMGDLVSFFKDIGYPCPVSGVVVRYGDSRVMLATLYDDPSQYHGTTSVEALAAEHLAGGRWQELLSRLGELTTRARDDHYQFLPAQSYLGGSP